MEKNGEIVSENIYDSKYFIQNDKICNLDKWIKIYHPRDKVPLKLLINAGILEKYELSIMNKII